MINLFGEDKLRAITYYRHSAEDKQENSVEIQSDKSVEFAGKVEVEIFDQFQDEGFTGVTADRPGLQAMFNKYVRDPNAPRIDYILVYDASRFGRFQNVYEAMGLLGECDKRGIQLATVNRGLPKKSSSVMDFLILILDLAQAGEFSKLLSDKVIGGCIKVSEQGYSAGGMAPYGYVRILLSETRQRLRVLKRGEHKMISNQRVTFEPATNGHADVVKRIFREFVYKGLFPEEIAERLNHDKIPTAMKKQWNGSGVASILSNEAYTGTRVYNKTWRRLKQKQRLNPSSEWTRCPNAHKALITDETFYKAKERLYWLRPASRNQFVRQFHSTQAYVWRYINEILQKFTEDQQFYLGRNFPVVFGSTYLVDGEKRACFYIPTEAKRFGKLLAVSIDSSCETNLVDSIRLIEAEAINHSNYLIVSESDEWPEATTSEIEGAAREICNEIIERRSPWLRQTPELASIAR